MGKFLRMATLLWYIILTLTGLVALGIGIAIQRKYSHYSKFVGDNIWTLPNCLICCGIVLILISIAGYYGLIKKSVCTIRLCTGLMVVILIAEIVLVITAYTNRSAVENIMEEKLNSTMDKYLERKDLSDAWSLIQTESSCCGTYGPQDWKKVFNNSTLPASCCTVINLDEASECTVKHAHTEGCFYKIFTFIESNTLFLAFGVIMIFLIQVSGIFCNYFFTSLRNRWDYTV